MDRRKGTPGRNRNVFKGSVLVSLLVESHHKRFPDRAVACKLGKRLFREGHIRSIFGAKEFEDSAQLYVWNEEKASNNDNVTNMTSPTSSSGSHPASTTGFESSSHRKADYELIQDIKEKVLNRSEAYNIVTSYNTFFQELEQDFGFSHTPIKSQELGWGGRANSVPYTSTLELKRDTVYSTDSSVDTQSYSGLKGGNKDIQNQNKHSSLTAYSETSLPKDKISQPPSQQNSAHVSTVPQSGHTSSQVKALPHTHISSHLSHVSPSVNLNQNQLKTPVISSHPPQQSTQMNASPNPPGSSSSYSDSTMVPEERLTKDQHGAKNLDYEFRSNQQGTTSSLMSSVAAESVDNQQAVTGDIVLDKGGHRWTHQQSTQLSVSKWTDPNLVLGDPQFINDRKKNRGVEISAEIRSRWLENGIEGADNGRRWPESTYSYSDNEKQLLEEMRRMKKEHQNTLRTYEGRINKLMAKMHELRNIAEMLENSSSKSSPYGVFPGKLALLNILGDKDLDIKKLTPVSETEQVPPPLPPRPGRGTKVYPNKPIMHTSVPMKPLSWTRIILEDSGADSSNTIWHGMIEPKINTEELERLFSGSSDVSPVNNLYDDLCLRRGKSKSQPICIYDAERSQRIISELKSLRCRLPDVIQAFTTLNSSNLHTDSFAELLELMTSHRELDKIYHHVKRKGGSHLDVPEYLVFELSKVEHFRERLEFLRFKNKLQINLFEIDQQLRELHTACEEIISSLSLKHVLETVLAVGNYMNAGTERGQADGFKVDILNSLKEMQDPSKQNNLLELIMRIYSHIFESELDFGCPTRFRLPEPSNMRHAAQVSFEDIQRALRELNDELFFVRNKLEPLSKQEGSSSTFSLSVTCENFMTAAVDQLGEEQKLLDNTQTHFWKTAAYFSLEGQQSSPHDFFQIWASFLHDCKYYWKLAHRNLAKAKFNADLSTKNQMSSSSSMPGFSNPKSAMIKHVTSFQQEPDLTNSKAQQLQHINSWIESIGKYAASGIQPEAAESGQINEKLTRLHDPSNDHIKASSPPYINQPYSNKTKNQANSDPNRRRQRKSKSDERTPHNKQSTDYVDMQMQHDRNSPKPIKATPPNVIKPKPVVKASPTMSSPSPNSLHLTQSCTLALFEQELPVDNNNNRNKFGYHDDFGFEPLYESLPPHEQSHSGVGVLNSEHPPPYSDRASFSPPLSSSMSPDPDNPHKKNANFFKSFLKRDQKRPSTSEESPHISHNSPHKTSGSAPINKLRNTFFNKISSSGGNSKKSAGDEPKNHFLNADQSKDSPPKPLRSLPMEQDSPEFNRGSEKYDGNKLDGITRNALNYQNFNYTEQPIEATPPLSYRPENLEDSSHKVGERLNPDRQEPAKEVFYSPGEGAIKLNEKTEHNLGTGGTNSAFSDEITLHAKNNVNTDGVDGLKPAGRSRVRAPIAFGSNMSISDAYRSPDILQTQTKENSEFHSLQPISKDKNAADHGINSSITVRPSPSDPKLLKANTVPVYKAKLIPNYENQTKYDPWFEGGIRGQAEAPLSAVHIPQASNSSEVYRQELQKKSEQYVGGGIYPAIGQSSQQTSGNSKDSVGTFSPPAYTTKTSSNSYHASPVVVSRDAYGRNVSPHKDRNTNQQSKVNQQSTGTPSQDHGQSRNKFENKNIAPLANYSQQQQPRQMTNNANFIKRPDGWQSSDRRNHPTQSDSYSDRRHHSVPGHRSSSAHNMLGRNYDSVKDNRMVQSLHGNMDDQHEFFPQGRVSRRDIPDKKITPTSHKENLNSQVKPPKSVTSLIDKFEKKPEGSQVGLIDVNDKPPSMTSTPVVRRKNHGFQPDNGNLSSLPRPYEDHSRSRSAGGAKDGAQHGTSENTSHQNTQGLLNNNQVTSMKSPHQAVAPFYVQPVLGPRNNNRQSSAQQTQGQGNQRTLKSSTEDGHRERNPPEVAKPSSIDQRQYNPSRDQDHNFKPINLNSHQQTQDRFSHDVRGHQETYSEKRGQYRSDKSQTDQNLRSMNHLMNEREHPEHSHSNSKKPVSQSSNTQPQNWSNYAKNPGASSAAHQSSTSHPGVIHRPEPVYPMSSPQQDSGGNRQQQYDHNQRQSDQQQNPGSNSTTYHPSSSAQSQSQRQQNSVLPNYGQTQLHRAQQYTTYQSPPSSQQKANSNSPPYYNMDPQNANSNFTNGKYVDELQRTPHLSNSAFDRPLKAGTYGRQPGAMAVVKPTVMHL